MNNYNNFYDVVIIGGGPAGLSAALYLSRAKYKVLVIEEEQIGGQITITSEVVNYPGVVKTSGKELTENMYIQALNFNSEFLKAKVNKIDLSLDIKKVYTSKGEYNCFGVVIATGAQPRKVGFIGEEEFKGHGVAYCATCDGEFFTNKEIFVVGGGFAAAEEAVFLTKYATHVTILVRGDDFTCAKSVADQAKNHNKITVLTNTEVVEVKGDSIINYIKYKNNKTNEIKEYENNDGFGVFVFAGYSPRTELVKEYNVLNEQGYIITDENKKTIVDGLYAAGDICNKNLRQVVTAVSDGAIAATSLEKYVSIMHDKTGIKPEIKAKETITKVESNTTSSIFDENIIAQLNTIFSKMENKITLVVNQNNTSSSDELYEYIKELVNLTDMLELKVDNNINEKLSVKLYKDNSYTGLAFYGIPGGHEFTSFVLGIYNASGSGQKIDESLLTRIKNINKEIELKIVVSLSCTMCPDLVIACQKIASLNDNIKAIVFDINLNEELKDKYNIMSVPCLVLNEKKITFGKKNIEEVLNLIENLD